MVTRLLLDENEVVEHVVSAVTRAGWNVSRFATTSETGVDVVGERDGRRMYVEAKGITSSKPLSNRYGMPQTSSQVFISVAAALLKAAEMRSEHAEAEVLIAVPSHSSMQKRLKRIEPVLCDARIGVLWVETDGSVIAWNTSVLHPKS